MFKPLAVGLGMLMLMSAALANQAEDIKYVGGKTFRGQTSYSNDTHGILTLTFNAPEEKTAYGNGTWQEKRGNELEAGALSYEVSSEGSLIIRLGAPKSKEQTLVAELVTNPVARLTISIHSKKTAPPAVAEGKIIAYTSEYFRRLRSQGLLAGFTFPPGVAIVDSRGYFKDLQEVDLQAK